MSRPWDQYEGSQCRPAIAERDAVRARMERELFQEQREEASETVAYVTPTPGAPGLCDCGTMPMLKETGIHHWVMCPGCYRCTGYHGDAGSAVAAWESRMGR